MTSGELISLKTNTKIRRGYRKDVINLGNMAAKMHVNDYVLMFVCQQKKNAYVVIDLFFPIRLCYFHKTKISDYIASNFVESTLQLHTFGSIIFLLYMKRTKPKKKVDLLVLVCRWLHATSFPKFVVALWLRESLVHFLQGLRAITKLETLAGSM